MIDLAESQRLPQLEHVGDATPFASRLHSMIGYSPLFEQFSLAEIRLMGHFMQVYRAQAGQEIIREGEPGDFMMIVVEPRVATCVAIVPALIAVLSADHLARIILEQPILGAKILMQLALMLSQRLRQTSLRLVEYVDKQRELHDQIQGPNFV